MSPEQFVYWLQGYSELAGERPTAEAWKSIQEHLNLVLKKVTPNVAKDEPKKQQSIQWPPAVNLPYIPPQPHHVPAIWKSDQYFLSDNGTVPANQILTC